MNTSFPDLLAPLFHPKMKTSLAQPASVSPDEAGRLRVLSSYDPDDLLRQPGRNCCPELERILAIAMRICRADGAYISLLYAGEAFVISSLGIEETALSRSHSKREQEFCQSLRAHPMQIYALPGSADEDEPVPHFLRATLSSRAAVSTYQGAPLLAEGPHCIGFLNMVWVQPHELNQEQRLALSEFATAAIQILETRALKARLRFELAERNLLFEQLQRSKRENLLLRSAVESSSVGIVVTEPKPGGHTIVYSNPAFQRISGYSEQELLGFNCRILQGPQTSPEAVQELRDALQDKRTTSVTLLNYHRSGTLFWNQVTISPVWGEGYQVVAWVGIQQDVTAQKTAEAALQAATIELEARVVSRTGQLQKLNGALAGEVEVQRKLASELEVSRGQLRALAAHLEHAREEERKRISREIHDELGQLLTHLKMELGLMSHKINEKRNDFANSDSANSDSALCSDYLEDKLFTMREEIDGAIQSVRRIASDLRPSVLDRLGLREAMSWLAEDFQRRAGVRCTFECSLDDKIFGVDRATALFRIAQEALTNVARHAGASRVTMKLRLSSQHMIFEISDNGVGFDFNAPTASMGLVGMKERAAQMGGVLSVRPLKPAAPRKKGTRLACHIPLDRRKPTAPYPLPIPQTEPASTASQSSLAAAPNAELIAAAESGI